MVETRWPDVERVLDRVLEHPTDRWAEAAQAECDGDAELYRAVDTLLRQAAGLDGYLEDPAVLVTSLLREAQQEPDRVGERFGAWRLVGEVGRGGMGVVYRAERADGRYEQTAAIKLLRTTSEAGEAMRRFSRERQVLATLDHPGIARLLDGGEGPDGRPFLAMEYVDGQPIDEYADQRRLPVNARLALFLQACDAVAHAHRHLVVHRDLKPSNILVSEGEDGRPRRASGYSTSESRNS
jgi:serine/threonine-protein kinase